jgi:hypothetical protein
MAQFSEIKVQRVLPRARFALNIGYGWRIGKIDPRLSSDERRHFKQLLSGFVWEASAAYFFNDWSGLGLDYSGYRATASSPGRLTDPPYTTGTIHTTDVMTYIGPAWVIRFAANPKWIWECSLGLGYLGYSSELTFNHESTKMKGSTLGTKYSVGVDHKFNENWAIGVSLQSLTGSLSGYTVTDAYGNSTTVKLEQGHFEGLTNVRLQVGMRYYIK